MSDFDYQKYMVTGAPEVAPKIEIKYSPEVSDYRRRSSTNLLIANKHRIDGDIHLAECYEMLYELYKKSARVIHAHETRSHNRAQRKVLIGEQRIMFDKNRSQLQYEDDNFPSCLGDTNGQHCSCFDIHDTCCDCDISFDVSLNDNGVFVPPTKMVHKYWETKEK